jgi:hypothetical protein
MSRLLLSLFIAALFTAPAYADLKGTYQLKKDKTLALSYRDDRHMLAAVGDDQRLLLKDGETWALKRQGDNWMALNANSAAGLLAVLRKKHDDDVPSGPLELRPLNRQEKVAGYTGDVFELSDGKKTYEVVLTDNPDVLAMTNAWRTMASQLAKHFEQRDVERLQQALAVIPQKGKGGLLRQGDNLTLKAIDKKVSASDFDLPAGTQTLNLPGS